VNIITHILKSAWSCNSNSCHHGLGRDNFTVTREPIAFSDSLPALCKTFLKRETVSIFYGVYIFPLLVLSHSVCNKCNFQRTIGFLGTFIYRIRSLGEAPHAVQESEISTVCHKVLNIAT
jgi:hypothetical protein